MGKSTGIQLNTNGDLAIAVSRNSSGLITSGLVVGNTLYQNQYIILKAQKGELKENPLMGVGIDDMTGDEDNALGWKKSIRENLASDGMVVSSLSIENGELILKADYK